MPSRPNRNARNKYHTQDPKLEPEQVIQSQGNSPDPIPDDLPPLSDSPELKALQPPQVLDDDSRVGHTRVPVLAREPTMLEAFSRTVRNYVPSSIHSIPTAAPSPPRVSRPVSFGSFMLSGSGSSNIKITPDRDRDDAAKRRTNESERQGGWGTDRRVSDVFVSDDEDDGHGLAYGYGHAQASGPVTYPSTVANDVILWARWDSAELDGVITRRLLFLGYGSGLQIWDCTDLGSVSEVFNLSGRDWGHVTYAGVLPSPRVNRDDPIVEQRPVIGIMTTIDSESASTFLVYSLYRHHVVKRIPLKGGLATFLSNEHFIVISTTYPSTLHILSASTFGTLFTIPPTSLLSFNKRKSISNNNVFQPDLRPVFAFSGRLLAYASPAPLPPSTPSQHPQTRGQVKLHTQSQSQIPNTSPGPFGLGMTQAELGSAAIKVGGSVLSGMKSLGGMAYEAARTSAGLALSVIDTSAGSGLGPDTGSRRGRFFSRSAPADSGRERRYSSASPGHDGYESADNTPAVAAPRSGALSGAGSYVTVLDLAPLLSSGNTRRPATVAEFVAARHQPIAHLLFSCDGTSIVVSPGDGQVSHVFQVRPAPKMFRGVAGDVGARLEALVRGTRPGVSRRDSRDTGLGWGPYHVYDLRRGRTSAIIEGVDWTEDGRWVAIGTRKRTVHVFAVNPYGGKPDSRSHMEGRVRNFTELQPLSIEVSPIVRLRALRVPPPDYPRVPLAFTFINPSDTSLPTSLLPPMSTARPAAFPPSSLPKSDASHSSESFSARPTNYQDMLVFDPTEGMLSLRRFTIELRARDPGLSVPTSIPGLGPTSISLPGMSTAGRLSVSVSPPTSKSGLTQMMEPPSELVGKDLVVATWCLQRHRDWGEIHQVLQDSRKDQRLGQSRGGKADWLAQAELSTCSRSPRVLPRPIYLSHQFSFHALGEDYHALIRRYQLDVVVTKLEVRKEVEVSAYSAGDGESFVEGFAAPRDVRRVSSSFDEPLASALAGGLDYSHPPAILPMLPNGMPGSKPTSFRNSIPIRTMAGLSDGMTEGIGRIRREIHKVRSPPLKPRPDSSVAGPVPLEFDEEDEDFGPGPRRSQDHAHAHDDDDDDDDSHSHSTSRGERDSGVSVSTPALGMLALDEGDEMWQGWGPEDNEAIEDAERFDDISAVGFLDEEQAPMTQAEKRKAMARGRRRL